MRRWREIKVGDFGRVVTGRTPPSSQPELFGDTYPFITPTDIDGQERRVVTARRISEAGRVSMGQLLVPADSIAYVCIASVGKVCMVDRPSVTNQQINTVVVDRTIHDPAFVFYALRDATPRIRAMVGGAATPIINKSAFSDVTLRVPGLEEQRRIGSILSGYDDLIENNTRRIAILEEMARRIYEEWFVRFRFPGHEGVRMAESEPAQIPESWRARTLADFGDVITGKTPSKANPDFYGNDVPFLKTPDMHGNLFILSTGESLSLQGAASQHNKKISPRSLCVSCIGTIGVVSITTESCHTNQQINSLTPANEAALEFLYFRLKDSKKTLENLGANGATMGNVNKSKFEALSVLTPPQDLLNAFHTAVAPMFSLIETLSRKNANLRVTRDLLLPKLISGELDVSRLPEPEPVET